MNQSNIIHVAPFKQIKIQFRVIYNIEKTWHKTDLKAEILK